MDFLAEIPEAEDPTAWLDEKPGRNIKPKRRSLPKRVGTPGFVTREIIGGPEEELPAYLRVGNRQSSINDPVGLTHSNLPFSLNKRGRWNLTEPSPLLAMLEQDRWPLSRVTVAEGVYRLGQEPDDYARYQSVKSFREMRIEDPSEGYEERIIRTRAGPASLEALLEKPKLPKKLRKKNEKNAARVRASTTEDHPLFSGEPLEDDPYVHYTLHKPCTVPGVSVNFAKAMNRYQRFEFHRVSTYKNRTVKHRHRKALREISDGELPSFGLDSEDEVWSDVEPEYEHRPSNNDLCLEQFIVTSKTQKKRKHNGSSSGSSENSSFSDLSLHDQDPLLWEKPWIRVAEEVPSWFVNDAEIGDSETSSAGEAEAIPRELPYKQSIEPVIIRLSDEDMDCTALKEAYGANYYECQTIPRTFVVDISESVRSVMTVAQGTEGVNELDTQVLVTFQVDPPSFSTMKLWDDTPWSHVSFSFMRSEASLPTFAKVPTNPEMKYAESVARSPRPCLSQTQAENAVLEQGNVAPKLQRQLTVVECHSFFASEDEGSYCGVCYEWPVSDIGFCLATCQHWFCRHCWILHIREQISSGRVPIYCPDSKCEGVLDCDILSTLLPLPLCRRYNTMLADKQFLSSTSEYFWCPNQKCGKVVRVPADKKGGVDVLSCECGHIWCSKCSGTVHWPASCEHAEKYLEKLAANGHDRRLIRSGEVKTVKVRRCPHCNVQMQKGNGCNYMLCRCGKAFCWRCLQKYDRHHSQLCDSASKAGRKHLSEIAVLRDVDKNTDSWMQNVSYRQCVEHRHARFFENTRPLRKGLRDSLKSSRRLEIVAKQLGIFTDIEDDFQRSRILKDAVLELIDSITDFYLQAHHLLEHVILWLEFNRKAMKKGERRMVEDLIKRLSFVTERVRDYGRGGDLSGIQAIRPHAFQLLRTIVSTLKKQKLLLEDRQ